MIPSLGQPNPSYLSSNSQVNFAFLKETCQLNITCTVLGVTEAVDNSGNGGVGSLMENATRAVDCPFDAEAAVRELKDEGYTTREGALLKQMPTWDAALRCVQLGSAGLTRMPSGNDVRTVGGDLKQC